MKSVRVRGRFLGDSGEPVKAKIKFIPSRLWVTEHDISYGTLAYEAELVNGLFDAELTPTTGHDDVPWRYTVICPVGRWTIHIPNSDNPVLLRDLLPVRFR